MNQEILESLLALDKREALYYKILNSMQGFSEIQYVNYFEYRVSDGIIPVLYVGNKKNPKYIKIFVAAQHNEYNGLFGIIEFFTKCQQNSLNLEEYNLEDQLLIFFPLMNPYGFRTPKKENKSGYYLRDGNNLNRYWRKIFVTEFQEAIEIMKFPDQVKLFKDIIKKYWINEDISIYIMDFHETSLIAKYLMRLNKNLLKEQFSYIYRHWIEEWIIENLLGVRRKQLFIRTGSYTHLDPSVNLSLVGGKLEKFTKDNRKKLPFYFCHSSQSKAYANILAQDVSRALEKKVWGIKNPLYDHSKHDHGCFVKMNEATNRPNVFSMELESHKQFFDLDEEIRKSKLELKYFQNKIYSIRISIELVLETITRMIRQF